MYTLEFCDIYDKYGWDYFSLTMGTAISKYFELNNITISNHLDLGCGVGTLCVYFYNNGIKTRGLDISEDMIDICKNKNQNIDFFVGDMTKYVANEKYDLITITCDAINHILKDDDLDKVFFNVSQMLSDDGFFIFDIIDKNKLTLNQEIVSRRDDDVSVYYYITNLDDLINTNIKVCKQSNIVYEYNILEKLYDIEYIKKMLIKNNLQIVKAENSILNEKQRFEDKIYFICRKVNEFNE